MLFACLSELLPRTPGYVSVATAESLRYIQVGLSYTVSGRPE